MKPSNSYYELKELRIDSIIHPEWGINSFEKVKKEFESLLDMMLRMGDDLEKISSIPEPLAEKAIEFIDYFYTIATMLMKFDIEESKSAFSFKNQDALIKSTQALFKNYLTGISSSDPNSHLFLSIYNSIISYEANTGLTSLSSELTSLREELVSKNTEYDDEVKKLETAKKAMMN